MTGGIIIKANLDINKLSDSFCHDSNNADIFEQLQGYIESNYRGCILLSGYRGSGKSAIVKQVCENNKNADYIFVRFNCSEYQNKETALRKLIRNTYIEFSKRKITFNNQQEYLFSKRLEDLHERTFYNVTNNRGYSTSNKQIKTSKLTFDIKPLITIAVLFLVTLVSDFANILPISDLGHKIAYVACLFLSIIYLCQVEFSKNRSKEKYTKVDKTSLYDNEIAEYHFKKVLAEAKDLGFKIVIVIDELDKIIDANIESKILSDFKPLFLSNLANFILISGQSLYYRFMNDTFIEDSIISSVFSKTFYVKLPDEKFFMELFNNSVIEHNISKEVLTNYIRGKMLNSNLIMRRYINLITQDTKVINNQIILEIDSDKEKQIEFESNLYYLAIEIYMEVEKEFSNLSDFYKNIYKYNLFLWINKITNFKGFSFDKKMLLEGIPNLETDFINEFVLNKMVSSLLDKMIVKGLLREITNADGTIYEYIGDNRENKNRPSLVERDIIRFMNYMVPIIEYTHYLKDVKIGGHKVIDSNLYAKYEFYIELYNKVKRDNNLSDSEIINISNVDSIIRTPEELVENFIYAYLSNYFNRYNQKIDFSANKEFDFQIYPEPGKICYCEVRYTNNPDFSSRKYIFNYLIDKYNKIANDTSKFLIILYISRRNIRSIDKMVNDFESNNKNIKIIPIYEKDYLENNTLDTYCKEIYDWLIG